MSELFITEHNSRHAEVLTSQLRTSGRPALLCEWRTSFAGKSRITRSEANPLPGYGEDSFLLCKKELQELESAELEAVAEEILSLSHVLAVDVERILGRFSSRFCSPSARFAAEVLIVGAAAGARGVAPWRLLASAMPLQRMETSAVVDPLAADFRLQVAAQVESGVRTFKLKCGRDEEAEWQACTFLRAQGSEEREVRLRLDPNGSWDLEAARRWATRLGEFPVDWIEDPTSEPGEWSEIGGTIPLAIDEPLGEMDARTALSSSAQIFVLKPMALGGLSSCLRWARIAEAGARRVSVSHLFDGPLAFDATVQLAFALQSAGLVPGLGFHQALDSDWSSEPSFFDGTELVLPEASA